MKEIWVRKQTVVRARDEQVLARRLHSFESALRLRDGSIVDVERAADRPRDRHVAVIHYELPLPEYVRTERAELHR